MTPIDKTAQSQTASLSFEFDLHHAPEKVWRALTDPVLLAEWLLPVGDLTLEPGAAFTFKTQPYRRALRLEDDGRQARRPAREDPMNGNHWIRQIHRWLSIAFTVTVIARPM